MKYSTRKILSKKQIAASSYMEYRLRKVIQMPGIQLLQLPDTVIFHKAGTMHLHSESVACCKIIVPDDFHRNILSIHKTLFHQGKMQPVELVPGTTGEVRDPDRLASVLYGS